MRDIERTKTEKYKFELYKFLDFIPDEHNMPNISQRQEATASWTSYLPFRRAQGIYTSGGVPD